jgi:4-azaleucine resistance transporter AzlC
MTPSIGKVPAVAAENQIAADGRATAAGGAVRGGGAEGGAAAGGAAEDGVAETGAVPGGAAEGGVAIGDAAQGGVRAGVRVGLTLAPPTFALGIAFGVLAVPVMGHAAPIVMSVGVFSGAAQFAALSVLAGAGTAVAAIAAAVLVNARWLAMGFAIAPSVRGGRGRRALTGQAIVDASFALASRGDGTFDIPRMVGATLPQFASWTTGTVAGVLAGPVLGDPRSLGLDGIFPAFYLALLVEEVRNRRALAAALIAGALALVLMPIAPPGIPVIAAALGALVGLRRP